MKTYIYNQQFTTESGAVLPSLEIAYHTYGTLNERRDNVVWVCHALTGSSDINSWWPGMTGDGLLLDTSEQFIVCANIPGSCYGSTGPLSVNPLTGRRWFNDFPVLTIRDVVNALDLLRQHLRITGIEMVIGASLGGQQAIEYAVMHSELIKRVVFIASNARQSPWAIAFNESQRLALTADPTFRIRDPYGGVEGLKAARSIAMLSYRNYNIFSRTQSDLSDNLLEGFRAATYQSYQGEKLVRRFNPWSYYRITQLTDSHNIGRNRGGVAEALKSIKASLLCIGITSDLLFPTTEIKAVAAGVPDGRYAEIESDYGHDGFLAEPELLASYVAEFLKKPLPAGEDHSGERREVLADANMHRAWGAHCVSRD